MERIPIENFRLRVRRFDVPLFGVIEVDTAKFKDHFSSTANTTTVEFSSDVFDSLAEELQVDAEGLMAEVTRYTGGLIRQKARGLGGGSLGDIGEIITFLLLRNPTGSNITRIVGYELAEGQVLKGGNFPQPDFFLNDVGQLKVLEVKSTESFDYQRLLGVNQRMHLQPCKGVAACRKEALPQLGLPAASGF